MYLCYMQLKIFMLPIPVFVLYAIEDFYAAHTCFFWGIFTFAKVER